MQLIASDPSVLLRKKKKQKNNPRNASSERRREGRMNTNELFDKSADIKILFLKSVFFAFCVHPPET